MQPQPQTIALPQAPPPLGRGGSFLLGRGVGVGASQPILRVRRVMPANELLRHRMGQDLLACPEFLHRQAEGPHKPYELQWGTKGVRGPPAPLSLSADAVGYTGGSGGGARVSVGVTQQYASSIAGQHPPNSTPQVQQATQNPQLRGQAPPPLQSPHNPHNAAGGPPSSVPHSQHISHHHSALAAHHSVIPSGNVSGASGGIANAVQQNTVGVNPGQSPAPPGPPHELNAQAIPQPSPQQIQQGSVAGVTLPGGVSGAHSIMYPSSNPNAHPQTPQSNAQVRRMINGQYYHPGQQSVMHTTAQQHRQVMAHSQPNMQSIPYFQHMLHPQNQLYHPAFSSMTHSHRPGASTQPQFQQIAQTHSTYIPPVFQMPGYQHVVDNNKPWNNMKHPYQATPLFYPSQPPQQQPPKAQPVPAPLLREKKIIPIIDPETNCNILEGIKKKEETDSEQQSEESSAANTPAPGELSDSKLQQSSDIASQFALAVLIQADESNVANNQPDTVDCAISTNQSIMESSNNGVLKSENCEKEQLISTGSVDSKSESVSNEVVKSTRSVPETKCVIKPEPQPVLQSSPICLPSSQPLVQDLPIVPQPQLQTTSPAQILQQQSQLQPQPQRPAKQPRGSQSQASTTPSAPPQGSLKMTQQQQQQSVQLTQQQQQSVQLTQQQPQPQISQPQIPLQQQPQQPMQQHQQPQMHPQQQHMQPQLPVQQQHPPAQLPVQQPLPPQMQPPPKQNLSTQPGKQNQGQPKAGGAGAPSKGNQNIHSAQASKGAQTSVGQQKGAQTPSVHSIQQQMKPNSSQTAQQTKLPSEAQPKQRAAPQQVALPQHIQQTSQVLPTQQIPASSAQGPPSKMHGASVQGPPQTQVPPQQKNAPQVQAVRGPQTAPQSSAGGRKVSGEQVPPSSGPIKQQEKRQSPPVAAAASSVDAPKETHSTGRQSGKSGTPSPVTTGGKKEMTPEPGQQVGKRGKDKSTDDAAQVKDAQNKAPTEDVASRLTAEAIPHGKQSSQGKPKTQLQSGENKVVDMPPAAKAVIPAPSQTPKSESPTPQAPKGASQASSKGASQTTPKSASQTPAKGVNQAQDPAPVAAPKEPQQHEKEVSQDHVNNIDEAKVPNHDGEPSGDKPKSTSSLKYPYKEGQWSPDNPEGKLQYDRTFLLEMQKNPLSLKRPDSLPNLEVVLDGPVNRSFNPRTKMVSDFTPDYLRNNSRNRMPGAFMQQKIVGRSSQQGSKRGQRVIDIKLSSSSEVKLKTSENAWKPSNKKTDSCTDEEEAKHQETLKRIRGILNKLTPDNFQKLVIQVETLNIDKYYTFDGVIGLIYEKAVDEQAFSTTYAELCQVLSKSAMSVKAHDKGEGDVRFRNIIISKCQTEFERDSSKSLNRIQKEKEIEMETDPEKKIEMKAMLDYEETRIRKRSVGNIKFIGELYKLKMLTSSIMMRILIGLLQKKDEESLECLCKLLTTVGKILEISAQSSAKGMEDLNGIFADMRTIVDDRSSSSRVRFLIMDVIDLRKNRWVPRREIAKPKTKAEVHADIRKEELEQQIALSNAPRKDDRERKRSRDNRGVGGAMICDDAGWNTVSTTRRVPFDTARLRNSTFTRNQVEGHVELGTGFSNWGRGSSGGLKEQQQEEEPRRKNRFAVLGNQLSDDVRRVNNQMPPRLAPGGNAPPPPRQMGGGSFGSKSMPPPSEKEATHHSSRMKPMQGDRSKSNSRSNSRASSRENSIAREAVQPETPVVASMDREAAEKFSKAIIEEYASNFDFKEACVCIQEKFKGSNITKFVTYTLEWVIDKSADKREKVGLLYHHLIRNKQLSIYQMQEGSKEIVEMIYDLSIDIPQVYKYVGEILCRLLVDSVMSFQDIFKMVEPAGNDTAKVFAHVIKQAASVLGEKRTSELWKSSGLRWETLLPNGADVKKHLSLYEIEFTINGPHTAEVTLPAAKDKSSAFDPKVVRLELMQLFKRDASEEEIFGWIDVNVGSNTNTKKFVRALTTALIESLLATSDGGSVVVSDNFEEKLKGRAKFIHKYVDNSQHLELPCIYGMQSLSVELQHPPGLLEKAFNTLYDSEVLSEDAFFEWEKDDNPEEQVGKGVCITSVKKFLTWLREDPQFEVPDNV